MKNQNNEEILIKAVFYTKSDIIEEYIFDQDVTFGEILNYFLSKSKNKQLSFKKYYYYNKIVLKPSDVIKNLVYIPKGKSLEIEIAIELKENEIMDDESYPEIAQIIKPKLYNFGLFIYFPKDGIINLEQYTENKIKEYNLNSISSRSSYCNSPDLFFISGGVSNSNSIDNFWIINNNDLSITLKNMPFGKNDHSMIYIPDNLNLVFIIGGNDRNCCFYDIRKDKFLSWANLNGDHIKPSLILINNYIYCIDKLTKEKNYFERTNISNRNPSWEKVFPKFKRNSNIMNKKIFWVSNNTNNSIIFGAGDKEKMSKTYVYDIINNEISLLNKNIIDIDELDNKTLEKVNYYYNVGIPKNFEKVRNIIAFNKIDKNITKIYFDFDNFSIKEKNKMEDYDSKNDNSKIEIKTSNLNVNKINRANIINKNLYSKLNNDFLYGNINNKFLGDNKDKQQGLNEQFFNNINNSLNNSNNFRNRNEPSLIERNEGSYTANKASVTASSLERQIGSGNRGNEYNSEKRNTQIIKNKLPQITKTNRSIASENNNNYGIKFEQNGIQLQQSNRYFNNNSQYFNNDFNA